MKELAELITNYGALTIMATLFIYAWIQDRTKNNKTLEELGKSNNNIAIALTLLKESFDNQNEKTTRIESDVKEIKFILNK